VLEGGGRALLDEPRVQEAYLGGWAAPAGREARPSAAPPRRIATGKPAAMAPAAVGCSASI